MSLLLLVTLVWAFSFSLIGVYLSGQVDDYVSVFIRTALALLLFLPLLARARPGLGLALRLVGIGAVQIGLMYLFLFHAFGHLSVPALLLFTTLTPLYVTLIDERFIGRRKLPAAWWLAAALAVAGAVVIRFAGVGSDVVTGFVLIQAANLCFAFGQVWYKRTALPPAMSQVQVFGFFFLGGVLVSGLALVLFGDLSRLPATPVQWGVLLWLGLGASGLGYLGWNIGARQVNTGQLAAMNNLLIPAGILVNVAIWNRDADWPRLIVGGTIIVLAVWLAGRVRR
ncbi:MAG: EamA family transporter [Wenzhouxiangella sp.]|jgi:carboxylate/amino acid/amine transporter|nr:EamA family transporter [Wenzhouxiangella sp.]